MIKWNLLGQILIFYCLAMVLVYVLSDYVMFPKINPTPEYSELPLIYLKTDDNKKIAAVYLKNKQAKYTILYSHGNAENIWNLYPFFEAYRDQDYSIFAYDYHGYGLSEGRTTEQNTYLDIMAAYRYLRENLNIPASHIILHGRSLGSGPTLHLASREPCAGIILESPLYTAFRVITVLPLFPIDKYRNDLRITKIKVPILLIHGKKDEVIPFWHGEKLYENANAPKTFFEVKGAGHNDLTEIAGARYWKEIHAFSNSLGTEAGK